MIRHLPLPTGPLRFAALAIAALPLPLAMSGARAAPPPAQPGCGTVVVLSGNLGDWRAPPVKCPAGRHVTYDAQRATFRTVRIAGVTGITLRGGTVSSGEFGRPAVTVDGSHDVRLTGMTITGGMSGVMLARGTDYMVDHNHLDGMRSDGIDINQVQRVTIDSNTLDNFHPAPGDHPDGIQAFSLAGQVPNRDLVFTNNRITGNAQGIDNFGDAAGTTNIRVEGNVVTSAFWHGITFHGVTNLIVRNNSVKTIPGARQGPRAQIVRTWLNVDNNVSAVACGNKVGDFPSGPGTRRCR